jgi:polysaccharide pyruvyl transferase WcaK-like protein
MMGLKAQMVAEKPRIGVLGAAFDTANMGVGALAAGTVSCILHVYPEAEVFFLNYEKFNTVYSINVAGHQVAIPLVNMRFSWRFWLRNNIAFLLLLTVLMKLLPFPALRRRWIAGNDCLRHLDESDFVVAISGGDSFSDIYGLERLLYVSLPQILALWSGKRLILLPQTLGPFKRGFAQAIAKYIMRRAELVYSRDHAGVRLAIQTLGSNASAAKVRFCYDVGFALDPAPPQRMDVVGLDLPPRTASILVGLNLSGLLFMGGYTRRNMFGLKVEYTKMVYDLINFLIEQKETVVLLVPHVFGQHNESDTTVCAGLYEALKQKYPGRIGCVRGSYNQSEIKYVIGTCDFFIGSRMHACIAAASQNVPVVPMAYSDKFVGVMQTIGIEANVVDLRKMNEEEIFNVIDQALEHRAQIRHQLAQTIPQVKESLLRLFEEIDSGVLSATPPTAVGKVPAAV